jgi:protein involved in temperature-dependent protein secretion
MKRFRARVWINEADYQLVRVDLEAIDDVTYGWGLVGRLHKGAKITYERKKVNDEVWLPARLRIIGTGRAVVFRTFAIDSTTEWSDYKKFGVKTEESYSH